MRKEKISFFNRNLRREYGLALSLVATITSLVFGIIDIKSDLRLYVALFAFFILIASCFTLYYLANRKKKVTLNIGNSTVKVYVGDIFDAKGFKVIAFNEYFDTIVDNSIISDLSLNGMHIKNYVKNIQQLDNRISNNEHLKDMILDQNSIRKKGKTQKYKLGAVHQEEDYLLTAFSRFDDNNRAFLEMRDYIECLLNFWDEIDVIYAGRSVSIPLLGSGLTRFNEHKNITDQELLEILIWTYKIRKIKFRYPSCVNIIIHENNQDKINFYTLKAVYNGV